MEKISVIIPAYNAEGTIKRCIESILSGAGQNLFDLEIVVVNNGSTDNTKDIVSQIASKHNEVILFSQENKGPAGSRDTGLKNATGDYIAYCDSDDWVDNNWLLDLYTTLKTYNADISCCRAIINGVNTTYNPQEYLVWNRDEAIKEFIIHKRLNGCLWNKLIRRELFDGISFSLEMWYWEDLYVVWQILKRASVVVRHNVGTYNFYVHPDSMCAKKISENRVYCTLKVWREIVDDCNLLFPNHMKAALNTQENWALSEMRSMIKGNMYNKEFETEISHIVRKAGIAGILNQKGLTHKLFALAIILNVNMVRVLYCIISKKMKCYENRS